MRVGAMPAKLVAVVRASRISRSLSSGGVKFNNKDARISS